MGKPNYLELIRERGKRSRVYRQYQLVGLELAELLRDPAHKALYIKLAKDWNSDELLRVAKDVAGRPNINNKGAYFMKIISEDKK